MRAVVIAYICNKKNQKNIVLPVLLVSTFFTKSAHNQMFEVSVEPIFIRKKPLHRSEQVFIAIDNFPAFTAYKVVMMTLFNVMIDRLVIHLAFIYATGLFQKLQRAIYSRFINTGHPVVDLCNNILRSNM